MTISAAQLQAYLLWKNSGAPLGSLGDAFLGLDSSGTSDVTSSLQGYIDISYSAGTEVIIGAGTWLTMGIHIYSGMTVRFMPGAQLVMNGTGPCISTLPAPGAVAGSTSSFGTKLINANINQNQQSGCAILWESVYFGVLESPQITGVAATGTWSHVNYDGTQTLPNAGLMLLGSHVSGGICSYNRVTNPFIREGFVLGSGGTAGTGGDGIWMGVTNGNTGNKPNYNYFEGGRVTGYTNGLYLQLGNDNVFAQVDFSENTTGIVVGEDATNAQTSRNHFKLPFLESCTTGISFTTEAVDNYVEGITSFAGTTTPFASEAGSSTAIANHLVDCVGTDWGPGYPGQTVVSAWSDFQDMATIVPIPGTKSGGYAVHQVTQGATATPGPQFRGVSYNGTLAATTATASGDYLVSLAGHGYETVTNLPVPGGFMRLKAVEAWTNTAQGTQWEVSVKTPTTGTLATVATFASRGSFMQYGLGFWATTPPTGQPTANGDVTVGDAGSTTAVYRSTTFPGSAGSTKYTIGDIVTALKAYGLIAP